MDYLDNEKMVKNNEIQEFNSDKIILNTNLEKANIKIKLLNTINQCMLNMIHNSNQDLYSAVSQKIYYINNQEKNGIKNFLLVFNRKN